METQRRLEQLAIASLTDEDCPDADLLASYILDTLVGTEQLTVAAHVRNCPMCSRDVALCRTPEPRPRALVARLLPLALAPGRRGAADRANVRQYVAADVVVELTIAPPTGDYWRVTGQVLRAGVGLNERVVTMRTGRRRYQQISDTEGFFTFEDLPSGRYTLIVDDGQIRVQIRSLVLRLDEDR
jgi:hypothetical protein